MDVRHKGHRVIEFTKGLVRSNRALNWSGVFLQLRDFKCFDLFFDFIGEGRSAGAVYNPVIKCERKRNDFCGFVFVFVRN